MHRRHRHRCSWPRSHQTADKCGVKQFWNVQIRPNFWRLVSNHCHFCVIHSATLTFFESFSQKWIDLRRVLAVFNVLFVSFQVLTYFREVVLDFNPKNFYIKLNLYNITNLRLQRTVYGHRSPNALKRRSNFVWGRKTPLSSCVDLGHRS